MNTDLKDIQVPLVLFLDDGVNIFASIAEAEQSQEAIDVRSNPIWFGYGFDSSAQRLRLDIFTYERKVFGFSLKEEGVKLRIDRSVSLDKPSDTMMDQMREYLLLRNPSANPMELEKQTARELFDRILHH